MLMNASLIPARMLCRAWTWWVLTDANAKRDGKAEIAISTSTTALDSVSTAPRASTSSTTIIVPASPDLQVQQNMENIENKNASQFGPEDLIRAMKLGAELDFNFIDFVYIWKQFFLWLLSYEIKTFIFN